MEEIPIIYQYVQIWFQGFHNVLETFNIFSGITNTIQFNMLASKSPVTNHDNWKYFPDIVKSNLQDFRLLTEPVDWSFLNAPNVKKWAWKNLNYK